MAKKNEELVSYELSGYRLEGGEWKDIEAGAPAPKGKEWNEIDLVTINLRPGHHGEDGFYRSADIFMGFDGPPDRNGDYYDLDDLAYEYWLEYESKLA